MRVAAIDVGTNTVRLLAVEFDDESVHVLDEFGEVTRLGASLIDTGRIAHEDAEKTLSVINECLSRSQALGIEHLDMVGTEVFRAAENGRDVAGEFSARTGHALRILSPENEAEAAYLGVVGWQDLSEPRPTLVVDVGGGSTQVISGEGIALNHSRSIPTGSLRLSEAHLKHDPPKPSELEAARKAAARALKPLAGFLPSRGPAPHVVGVGGTVCAIGAWVHKIVPYDGARVNGTIVTLSDLGKAIAEWSGETLQERMERGGMSQGRARVVPGGGIVLQTLLETLGLNQVEVSTRGIRHGMVLRRVLMA
jgi:exopolyphosphatase/guanosine-5'-triphosphate,3'-diphosphate pyrophosphatase